MNLELKVGQNNNYKKWISVVIKCILYAVCTGALIALTHMICSRYILHVHGKPTFVSNSLILYSGCSELFIAIGYLMIGYNIPVKNSILRGLAYMFFYWSSNFLPQFMGMAFADGPIAEQAFVISDLVCDSIVRFIGGILIGLLFTNLPYEKADNSSKSIYLKPVLVSLVVFPLLVIVFNNLIAFFVPAYSSLNILIVSEQVKVPFYINFYSWFILSGAMISVFYQVTDYGEDKKSWFKFAMKYSLLLWTPVVMIMVLFGTEIIATIIFNILFIIIIAVFCWINNILLKKVN